MLSSCTQTNMGYLHINNLYQDPTILAFKECYALEKVHGTSAHITYKEGKLTFFSGGVSHTLFTALFNEDELKAKFIELGHTDITIYGEAFGGKCQKMSDVYGKDLRFVAFDVKIGEFWLNVPDAADVVRKVGLKFVRYNKVPTDLIALDYQRDLPSSVAEEVGIMNKHGEGVVLRPLFECFTNRGRVITKHKRPEFRETASIREVDPSKALVLEDAASIALEWVVEERLSHVLDKLIPAETKIDMTYTPKVINAMLEDVKRESNQEFEWTAEVSKAIANRTRNLYKARVMSSI